MTDVTDRRTAARGLAWFGIGLGLVEALVPRAFSRAIGLERHAALIRLFGLREIGSGIAILTARRPEHLLWLRVAGDGLDGAVLAAGLRDANPRRGRTLAAALAVAPIVLLDGLYARDGS